MKSSEIYAANGRGIKIEYNIPGGIQGVSKSCAYILTILKRSTL